jgi:hypothetical protein
MTALTQSETQRPPSLGLRLSVYFSLLIAIAAAARRLIALAYPANSAPRLMASLDSAFQSHTLLTVTHIVPAMAFVCLIPFVLLQRPRRNWPTELLFFIGLIVGVTAYAMSRFAIGGWTERSAVLLFNSLFLFALGRAYAYRRSGQLFPMMRWLARAIWILLGIATTRPVVAVFFATSRITHLGPEQFFGPAFWIGFSINTIAAEFWVRSNAFQRYFAAASSRP